MPSKIYWPYIVSVLSACAVVANFLFGIVYIVSGRGNIYACVIGMVIEAGILLFSYLRLVEAIAEERESAGVRGYDFAKAETKGTVQVS